MMWQSSNQVISVGRTAVSIPRRDDSDEAYAIDVELKSRSPAEVLADKAVHEPMDQVCRRHTCFGDVW